MFEDYYFIIKVFQYLVGIELNFGDNCHQYIYITQFCYYLSASSEHGGNAQTDKTEQVKTGIIKTFDIWDVVHVLKRHNLIVLYGVAISSL